MRRVVGFMAVIVLSSTAFGQSVEFQREVDPITDEAFEYLAVYSDGYVDWAALVVRCDSDKLDIFVDFSQSFGKGFERNTDDVTWRFDQHEPKTSYWNGSEGGTALFLPDYRFQEFALHLLSSNRFVIRVTNGEDIEGTFIMDIGGDVQRYARRLECLVSQIED